MIDFLDNPLGRYQQVAKLLITLEDGREEHSQSLFISPRQ
jgi:hypothetical protein